MSENKDKVVTLTSNTMVTAIKVMHCYTGMCKQAFLM